MSDRAVSVPIHHSSFSLFQKSWLHTKSRPPRSRSRFPTRRSKQPSNSFNSAAEILKRITTAATTAAATAWCKGNRIRARSIPVAMFPPSQKPPWTPKMKALRAPPRGTVVLKICTALQRLFLQRKRRRKGTEKRVAQLGSDINMMMV